MKIIPKATAFAILLLLAGQVYAQKRADHAPGEILIKLTPGLKAAAANALGGEIAEVLGDTRWVRIKIADGTSVEEAVRDYGRIEGVEAAQPNFYYRLMLTPNDPLFNPPNSMYGLNIISAPLAWDIATGSPAVVVANIDTGIRYTHEDLAANVWTNPGETPGNGLDDDGNGFVDDYYGYDFRFNDADPADEFGAGHGTHTSGTIGAVGNNGLGVVGVNWNVKIMAIKIYSSSGSDTTSAMLINAYNYVRMMKNRGVNIRVTNNSYGGCNEACGYDQATKDALDAMGDAGILNVFAAGNDARNTDLLPAYPASYSSPSIISVANSTSADTKAGSSNWGVVTVDLAAPGSNIQSTTRTTNSSYGLMTGTSMATPHVTGAAALLSGLNPSLSAASLKASILNNVDLLANWNGIVRTGGRLNLRAALQNQTVCTFGLSQQSMTVPTKGGHFSVGVTAQPNCDFGVKSNVNWIKVATAESMSGSGTVTFRVTVNPTITRSGTITIAGQAFTVRQSRSK